MQKRMTPAEMRKRLTPGKGGLLPGLPGIRDVAGSEVDMGRAVSIWQAHWDNRSDAAQQMDKGNASPSSHHECNFKNLIADAEIRLNALTCAQADKDTGHGSTVKALRLAEQSLQIWGQDVGEPLPLEWLLSAALLLNLFATFRRRTQALQSAGGYLRKVLMLEQKILDGATERMTTVLQNVDDNGLEEKKHGAFLCWVEACFLLARTRVNLSAVAGELGRHRVAFSHSLCAIRLITWGLLGPPVGENYGLQLCEQNDGSSSATSKSAADRDSDEDADADADSATGRSNSLLTVTWENLGEEDEGDESPWGHSGTGDDEDQSASDEEDEGDESPKAETNEQEAALDPPWYAAAGLRNSLLAGQLLRPADEEGRPKQRTAADKNTLNLGTLYEPGCEVLVAALLAIGGACEHRNSISLALQAYRSAAQVVQGLPTDHPLKTITTTAHEELQSVKVSRNPSSPEDSDSSDDSDGIKIVSDEDSTSGSEDNASIAKQDNWQQLRELALRKSFISPGRTQHALLKAIKSMNAGDQKKIQCMELLKKAKQGVIQRYELLGMVALRRLEFSLIQRFHTLPRAFKALDTNCRGNLNLDEWVLSFERNSILGASPDLARFAFDYILHFSPKATGQIETRRGTQKISEEDFCSFCNHMSRCWKRLPSDSWSFCTEVDGLLRTLRKRLLEIYDDVHQAFGDMGWQGEHMITDLEFKAAIPFWDIKGFTEMDVEFLFEALDIDSKGSLSYMELEFCFRKQALDDTARRGLHKHVLQSLIDFRTRTVARFGSLEKAVKIIDTNRDHTVDEEEFRKAMERYDLAQDEITELWKAIDFQCLGKIDSQDLLKFLHQIGTNHLETNECVAEIKPQKVSEVQTQGARKAWVPKSQGAARFMASKLKRMVVDRSIATTANRTVSEAALQKEKDLHLSLVSRAAVRRGEIDEPWMRAAIENMQTTISTDKAVEAIRYGDEPMELRDLRQRHFSSVRNLVKATQHKNDLAAEKRPTRPWSAGMNHRELEKKQLLKNSTELRKTLRERDPSVKALRSLVKDARAKFGPKDKKDKKEKMLFQKKTAATGSFGSKPIVNSDSKLFSTNAGRCTIVNQDLEDLIESGLKKTFLTSATAVEEMHDFIYEASTPAHLRVSKLENKKDRHIPDKIKARKNLSQMLKVGMASAKLLKGRKGVKDTADGKEKESQRLSKEDDQSGVFDPGPESTAELADEVRAGLAGEIGNFPALRVFDRVGPYSPSSKKRATPVTEGQSAGARAPGDPVGCATASANLKNSRTGASGPSRKADCYGPTFSQLAKSVQDAKSANRHEKPKRIFDLSFLDYESNSPNKETIFDENKASGAKLFVADPSASPSKISPRPQVSFMDTGDRFSVQPRTPSHLDPSSPKSPVRSMQSPAIRRATAERPPKARQRFDLWNEDSEGVMQMMSPSSAGRRHVTTTRNTLMIPSRTGETESHTKLHAFGTRRHQSEATIASSPGQMRTQNLIGGLEQNVLEKGSVNRLDSFWGAKRS